MAEPTPTSSPPSPGLAARRIATERGATVIPPFDHEHVIAGQGTAAKELVEDVGPLDDLYVCCGGATAPGVVEYTP